MITCISLRQNANAWMTVAIVGRNTLSRRLGVKIKEDLVGRYRAGERLPSARQLAERHHVSPVTIGRVLQHLSEEGIVYRIPSSGTYLCEGVERHTTEPSGAEIELTVDPRTRTVAKTVIVGRINWEVPGRRPGNTHEMMSAAERHIQQAGGSTVVINTDKLNAEAILEAVLEEIDRGANSLLVLSERLDAVSLARLAAVRHSSKRGFPVIAAGISPKPSMFDCVAMDLCKGVHDSVRYLTGLGHRRIAFVGPRPFESEWLPERIDAFLAGLYEAGLEGRPDDLVFSSEDVEYDDDPSNPGYACGANAAIRICEERRWTAVVAANDYVAAGLIDTLTAHGIAVPDDISVIGFDDAIDSGMRGLSTVHRPVALIGVDAVDRLMRQLEEPHPDRRTIDMIAPTLIIRRSTAAPPRPRSDQ